MVTADLDADRASLGGRARRAPRAAARATRRGARCARPGRAPTSGIEAARATARRRDQGRDRASRRRPGPRLPPVRRGGARPGRLRRVRAEPGPASFFPRGGARVGERPMRPAGLPREDRRNERQLAIGGRQRDDERRTERVGIPRARRARDHARLGLRRRTRWPSRCSTCGEERCFTLPVPAELALDAFNHPYAYAADDDSRTPCSSDRLDAVARPRCETRPRVAAISRPHRARARRRRRRVRRLVDRRARAARALRPVPHDDRGRRVGHHGYNATVACAALALVPLVRRLRPADTLAAGLVVFTAASLACASAGSLGFLIGARCVQGLGAALLLAASLPVLARARSARDDRARLPGRSPARSARRSGPRSAAS